MVTHHKGDAREVLALDTFVKLMRAAESVLTRVHRQTASSLTVSQFGVLEALHHLGPLNPCEMGAKLLKSSGNITLVIDNLEKRGLVKRERDPADRRRITVCLTSQGERMIQEIFPRHVQIILAEMEGLTEAQQEELGRLCRHLGTQRAEGDGCAPETPPTKP